MGRTWARWFVIYGSLAGASRADEGTAYKLDAGPSVVESVDSMTLHDAKRDKEILVKVIYPSGDGPFPVIVFSHGFGAGKEAFGPISRHWASHGYVCIHPQHADARLRDRRPPVLNGRDADDEPVDDTQKPAPRRPDSDRAKFLERLRRGNFQAGGGAPEKIADRVRDVTAVIDALDQVEALVPSLKGKLDRDRIGVGGHSYGACVSMLIGGATIEFKGETKGFADPRVKCVLPISAAGTGEYGLTKDSWKGLTKPALFITGTRDVRPGHEVGWRREPFDSAPPGDKFFLNIEGATHFHFGGGPAASNPGRFPGGGTLDRYTALVKTTTVAFWDGFLKDERDAKDFLEQDAGFNRYAGTRARLSAR
jgi:predicted dienelactone hydrolase